MAGLIIKPRSRIFHGHHWVYSSEVKKTFGDPQPGEVISLKDFRDRPLGTAIYNPNSQILARRISRRKQDLDLNFFTRRLQRAIEYRENLQGIDPQLCRLVWSEADGLPGVIVDRYQDVLVLQTLTLAMDQRKELIVEALTSLLSPKSIIERNDNSMRIAEGLEKVTSVLYGEEPPPFEVKHQGISFAIDPLHGQKTGLYLDQLPHYAHVAPLAHERRVLDCFTHQGGFALACAKAGAASVEAVDSSESAIAAAQQNAQNNQLDIRFHCANAFDFLKEKEQSGAEYDMVILDPPSFARNKKSLKEAFRGYKEIHLRALKLLKPGGLLVSYTCSHHVKPSEFRNVVLDASVDAKRSLRELEVYRQSPDHPVLLGMPETEYFRGYLWEVVPSF